MYARLRGREVECWPDGREILFQPIRLVRAFSVLAPCFSANEKQPTG
jgi:hypothetical protein